MILEYTTTGCRWRAESSAAARAFARRLGITDFTIGGYE